jgi:hypothetical protein
MKDYEEAEAAFEAADEEYKRFEILLMSGDWMDDTAAGMGKEEMKEIYRSLVDRVKELQEERNSKLRATQDILRQKVVLAANKWRGPEGKPTLLTCGPFRVTSVTKRSFDQKSLFDLCQKHGILESLLGLKIIDKDGIERPVVRQVYDIDFEPAAAWLKTNGHTDILDGAYDEKESTPQVKGPKPVAFLGDTKEK